MSLFFRGCGGGSDCLSLLFFCVGGKVESLLPYSLLYPLVLFWGNEFLQGDDFVSHFAW